VAEFQWWLLIVGLVAGGGLVALVFMDSARRDLDVAEDEREAEAHWIAERLAMENRDVDPSAASAVLWAHREYLGLPPPDRIEVEGSETDLVEVRLQGVRFAAAEGPGVDAPPVIVASGEMGPTDPAPAAIGEAASDDRQEPARAPAGGPIAQRIARRREAEGPVAVAAGSVPDATSDETTIEATEQPPDPALSLADGDPDHASDDVRNGGGGGADRDLPATREEQPAPGEEAHAGTHGEEAHEG
jgi:hypothetical protein